MKDFSSATDSGKYHIARRYITLVGPTGAGKSTIGNLLAMPYEEYTLMASVRNAARRITMQIFEVGRSMSSCTTEIKTAPVVSPSKFPLSIVDTPGTYDTDGRSERFFRDIMNRINELGGLIFLTVKDDKVDMKTLNMIRILHVILQDKFSDVVVLVKTHAKPILDEDEDELAYLTDVSKSLTKDVGVKHKIHFRAVLGLSTILGAENFLPEKFIATSIALAQSGDSGLQPGSIGTWESLLDRARRITTKKEDLDRLIKEEGLKQDNEVKGRKQKVKEFQALVDEGEKPTHPVLMVVSLGIVPIVRTAYLDSYKTSLAEAKLSLNIAESERNKFKKNSRKEMEALAEKSIGSVKELRALIGAVDSDSKLKTSSNDL
ncbi:hypothetical protein HK096_008347 [Nowakowskiella sp. JEL0078]|nr:hypothetical protein HK096_008347 [Nowakowskiella sp. JEL0078]